MNRLKAYTEGYKDGYRQGRAEPPADYLALLNLEEAVRCMMGHRNWMECGKVEKALANLHAQRAVNPDENHSRVG
jgi:hypothetical protein